MRLLQWSRKVKGRERKMRRRVGGLVRGVRGLQRYKRLLLAMREALSPSALEASAPVPAAGSWQGDLMDQANAGFEAELQIRLRQTNGRLARTIEEALSRLRRGTYGICEACSRPIARARLNAVPWTGLCRECKEREHA